MNDKINLIENIRNKEFFHLQKYIIEFNTDTLPIDFYKWIQLDEKIMNININHDDYLTQYI